VSKELNHLAVEKLYRRVDIRLWSEGNTDWMIQHLQRAQKYAKHIRELVVEDERIAPDADSAQYGHVALPFLWNHSDHFNAGAKDPAERDRKLEQILDLIPINALRTFR